MKKQGAVKQKHKKVLKKMMENGGNLSKSLKEVGYSDSYSHNEKIINTKTWKETIEEVFPTSLLTEVHKKALEARRVVVSSRDLTGQELVFADHDTRLKALDMAYKLRGDYAPEKIQTVNPYEGLDNEEIDQMILQKERELNIIKKSKPKSKKKKNGKSKHTTKSA